MGAIFDRLTIKQKIMALVSLVFILATLILSVAFDRVIVRHEIAGMEEEAALLSAQADRSAAVYLQVLKEDLVALARTPELRQGGSLTVYLGNPSAAGGYLDMDPEVMQGYELAVFNTFQNFANAHGVKAAQLSYAMADGGYLQFPAALQKDTFDPRTLGWYHEAMLKPGAVHVSKPFRSGRATPAIAAYVTVAGWDGAPIGVLAMDIDLAALHELAGSLQLDGLGYLMLLDGDGTILADPGHADTAFKKLDEAGLGDLSSMGPRTSGIRRVVLDGTAKYANVYTSKATGLKYLAIIDEERLMGGVSHLRLVLAAVLLTALAGGLAGAWWLTNKITAPLRQLEERADSIARGNLAETADLAESDDEIGRLSSSFQEMGAQLRQQLQDVQQGAADVAAQASTLAADVTGCRKGEDAFRQTAENALAALKAQGERLLSLAAALEALAEPPAEAEPTETSAAPESADSETTENTEESHLQPAAPDGADAPLPALQKAQALAGEANASLAEGRALAQGIRSAIKKLRELAEEAAAPAASVRSSFREVEDAIRLVTDISEQTNLLALNAAVESVRYNGKAKSKFTAVAEEIRKLAARAGEAAAQSGKSLKETRAALDAMAASLAEGKSAAEQGRKDAQKVEEFLFALGRRLHDQQDALKESRTALAALEENRAERESRPETTGEAQAATLAPGQREAVVAAVRAARQSQAESQQLQTKLESAQAALRQRRESLDRIAASGSALAQSADKLHEGLSQFQL